MKEDEPDVVAHIGERYRRSSNFQVVHEQSLPAYGIPSLQVARSGLVDGKAAERVTAAGEEQLRQWDRRGLRRQRSCRWYAQKVVGAIGVQDSNLRIPCQDPSLLKGVVGRILHEHPAKIRLRAQRAGRQPQVGEVIAPLVRINGVVPGIAQVSEK